MSEYKVDQLRVEAYPTRREMGIAAAADIAKAIRKVLEEKEVCNMIFAAAPSQNEVLTALVANSDIAFERINAFHMDEYCGLEKDAPQRFARFLADAVFDRVPFRSIHYLNDGGTDPEEECSRYGALLLEYPTDIVCLGIGENGHIAFNDPPVADFRDEHLVKQVTLDETCRNQQVHDGCFAGLDLVPTHALTLTIPALFRGRHLFCVVPAKTKAAAVRSTLNGPVSESCPASILRLHPDAKLYLDADSASLL